METTPDDLTPKERELQRYLIHLVKVHSMTNLEGVPECFQCTVFKAALA